MGRTKLFNIVCKVHMIIRFSLHHVISWITSICCLVVRMMFLASLKFLVLLTSEYIIIIVIIIIISINIVFVALELYLHILMLSLFFFKQNHSLVFISMSFLKLLLLLFCVQSSIIFRWLALTIVQTTSSTVIYVCLISYIFAFFYKLRNIRICSCWCKAIRPRIHLED